jgi:hypothetical protein
MHQVIMCLNRSLIGSLVIAAYMVASFGAPLAQDKQPEHQPATASPRVVMPDADKTVLLVRTALLTLNDALRSGNFTVLRDVSAPAFREANTAAQLARIFTSLQTQKIDLSAVATMVPKLSETPVIDARHLLHINGYFPGHPVQINFNLIFQVVRGHWRLFGLSVNPVTTSPRAAKVRAKKPLSKSKKPKK